jgi:adenine phosphoribosyltransferase
VSAPGLVPPPDPRASTPSSPSATADGELASAVARTLRDVADFPEPGVIFKDITPVLADPELLRRCVAALAAPFANQVDLVAAIEARGFILGAPVAVALGAGFIPVRKAGKLPRPTVAETYQLEYGTAAVEVHEDALQPGQRVLVVDDVIATGGTVEASLRLVHRLGGTVVGVAALCELSQLGGRARMAPLEPRVLLTL